LGVRVRVRAFLELPGATTVYRLPVRVRRWG
jgi:hypothetical protein